MSVLGFVPLYAKYAGLFEKQTPKLLSWPIYIYIWIDSMLTMPRTSRKTGRFVVFFSKAVPTIMDSFAPEVTVESL